MSTQVFYRKWRPKSLGEVVGQEPITHTLRQALLQSRIAHAYLFCGPRGTGKTSTARILAKAVNCLSPVEGEPCNICSMCQAINEGRAVDLIEMDAASNRRIDDIRNINDKVRFSPNEAKYKVYIVDEVHMLTQEAFNALLKTLEEPPPHAIFVLATTEPHRVPLTIISRCQRFDFHRISPSAISERLERLCQQEDISAEPEALAAIARAASGSLRDAENMLEQLVVSNDSPIGLDQVETFLGLGDNEKSLDLACHILGGKVREGLLVINELARDGHDLRQLERSVIEYLRAALLLKSGVEESQGYTPEVQARLKALAQATPLEQVLHAITVFAKPSLRRDESTPLHLELALIEAANRTTDPSYPGHPTEAQPPQAVAASIPQETPSPGGEPPQSTRQRREEPSPSAAKAVAQEAESLIEPPSDVPEVGVLTPALSKDTLEPNTAGEPLQSTRQSKEEPPPPAAEAVAQEAESLIEPVSDIPEVGVPTPASSKDTLGPNIAEEPLALLRSQWTTLAKSLDRVKFKRFFIGPLLRACRPQDLDIKGDSVILRFTHRSNMERMEEELGDPRSANALSEALVDMLHAPYRVSLEVSPNSSNGIDGKPPTQSHMVRAALAMGARITNEEGEEHE